MTPYFIRIPVVDNESDTPLDEVVNVLVNISHIMYAEKEGTNPDLLYIRLTNDEFLHTFISLEVLEQMIEEAQEP